MGYETGIEFPVTTRDGRTILHTCAVWWNGPGDRMFAWDYLNYRLLSPTELSRVRAREAEIERSYQG